MALKNIFKGKIDAQSTFDTIASGIDKLAFTQEERSDFNKMLADKTAEFYASSLSESTIRSKTRRFIAIAVIVNVFLVFWLCVGLAFFGKDISIILKLSEGFSLSTAFIMVLAFFFGGYYLKGVSLKKQ
jgi:hypothetical protein